MHFVQQVVNKIWSCRTYRDSFAWDRSPNDKNLANIGVYNVELDEILAINLYYILPVQQKNRKRK